MSISRPRSLRKRLPDTRAGRPAGAELSVATASLMYLATRIEQRLAGRGSGGRHLIALRRKVRAELRLREGLLLTLANSGVGSRRKTRSAEPGISRDPRLAAMFEGAGRL